VDSDSFVSAPEYKDVWLTSVMKNMDVAVFNAIKAVGDGTFKGGTFVGTLANEGVGLAPFHEYESKVPAGLQAELDQLKADIVSGKITVDGALGQ
jgi:basic membrane protein A